MDNQLHEIAVCSTGDTWDVCRWDENGMDTDEPIWCQTKSEAIKEARKLFNATEGPVRLIVERKGAFNFEVIREKAAAQ